MSVYYSEKAYCSEIKVRSVGVKTVRVAKLAKFFLRYYSRTALLMYRHAEARILALALSYPC